MVRKAKQEMIVMRRQVNRIRKYDLQRLLMVPKGYEMSEIKITDCDSEHVPWVEFEIYQLWGESED